MIRNTKKIGGDAKYRSENQLKSSISGRYFTAPVGRLIDDQDDDASLRIIELLPSHLNLCLQNHLVVLADSQINQPSSSDLFISVSSSCRLGCLVWDSLGIEKPAA